MGLALESWIKIILESKETKNQITSKNFFFGYLCKFLAAALTLSRERHISTFFKHYLIFAILRHFLFFFRAWNYLIRFYSKFWVIEAKLLASKCNCWLLCNKPCSKTTVIISKISNQRVCSSPAGNYMFKVNNRNTRARFEVCSKLTIKTPEGNQ